MASVSDSKNEMAVYVCWNGVMSVDHRNSGYVGGERSCIWVDRKMGVAAVTSLVEDAVGSSISARGLFYNLKYDRTVFIPLRRDSDVATLFKGNDDVGYVFVGCPAKEEDLAVKEGERTKGRGGNPVNRTDGILDGAHVSEAANNVCPEKNDRVGKNFSARDEMLRPAKCVGYMGDADLIIEQDACFYDGWDSPDEDDDDVKESDAVDGQRQGCSKNLVAWKQLFKGKGQVFATRTCFRESVFKYALANGFGYRFVRNCLQRIAVKCVVEGCPFYVCARGRVGGQTMYVKEFDGRHVHNVGDECTMGKWRRKGLRASVLGSLMESKLKLDPGYSPSDIVNDILVQFGIEAPYLQCWRAREYVRMLALGKPEDQYKLLPWLGESIRKANPGTTAFVDVDGNVFRRMFVSYAAPVDAFLQCCRKVIFVDGTHLSGPYGGTLLAAVALDADNHLLDLAYAVVGAEDEANWDWFLHRLRECTAFVDTVVMSDRNPALLTTVAKHFGKEFHSYCLRHLMENFTQFITKNGEKSTAGRDMVKEMLNKVAYAATNDGYNAALDTLRAHNCLFAQWVEENEPEQWAESKFIRDRWGRLNNNPIESWNNWMRELRQMPIPWLVTGHLQKLIRKTEKRNAEIKKWKTVVGPRVEVLLKETVARARSITAVNLCNSHSGTYSVDMSHSRRHIVSTTDRRCTCQWWQLQGLPCVHAMAVIIRAGLPVYDFVSDFYKKQTQTMIYLEGISPIGSEDGPYVDNATGQVVGGDDGFCRSIVPPTNPRPPGRPRKRRIESQRLDKKVHRCSRCLQIGHHRNTCKETRIYMFADPHGGQHQVDEAFVNAHIG